MFEDRTSFGLLSSDNFFKIKRLHGNAPHEIPFASGELLCERRVDRMQDLYLERRRCPDKCVGDDTSIGYM